MGKSQYGKGFTFLWEGWRSPDTILLVPTPSTFLIEDELQKKIDVEWEKVIEKEPEKYDGLRWRTESVNDDGNKLLIYVSPTTYSLHNVLRHEQNQPMGFYPNPITVNAVQETSDGYILIGVRDYGSDQYGLALMGSGFVDRHELEDGSGNSKYPENLGDVLKDECIEETKYEGESFDITNARAMNVIFGSNHDTTIGFYLPIFAGHNEVSVGNNEHSEILFLPNDITSIQNVLNKGNYKGIPAADHLLGCLESYIINLDNGNIKPQYQHK